MSRSRRVLTRALAVVAGSLGALGLAEVGVRLLDIEPTFEVVFREVYQLSPNPILEYELKPGAPDGPTRINSAGFRDREFERAKPPGVFRIVAVGDSVTYGRRDDPLEAYPKHLERLLNERASGLRFEVLNLGVHGYNVTRIAERLRVLGLAYQPDLVLYGYVLNDPQAKAVELTALTNLRTAEELRLTAELQRSALRWLCSSRLFLLVAGRLRSGESLDSQPEVEDLLFPNRHSRPPGPNRGQERRGDFYRALHEAPEAQRRLFEGLDRMAAMTREAGVRVVVAIFPLFYLLGDGEYPLLDVNAFLTRELSARGFAVIDLLPRFEAAKESGLDCSADALHPNQLGNATAAAEILEQMLALELLPAGSMAENPGGAEPR